MLTAISLSVRVHVLFFVGGTVGKWKNASRLEVQVSKLSAFGVKPYQGKA